MSAFRRFAAIFAGIFLIVSCGGTIDARVDCDDKTLVILPCAVEAEGQSMNHFNSKIGDRIATLASGMVSSHEEDAKVLEPQAFKKAFKSGVPTPSKIEKICGEQGVDLVVISTLTQWRLRDPRNPGLNQGEAGLNVSVVDSKGQNVYKGQLMGIQFPLGLSEDPNFAVPGQSSLTLTEEQVRKGLEQSVARALAELFYDHEAPK